MRILFSVLLLHMGIHVSAQSLTHITPWGRETNPTWDEHRMPSLLQRTNLHAKKIIFASRPSITVQPGEKLYIIDGRKATQQEYNSLPKTWVKQVEVHRNEDLTAIFGIRATNGVVTISTKNPLLLRIRRKLIKQ